VTRPVRNHHARPAHGPPVAEFPACPRCGSRDLHIPTLADGVVPETDNLAEWVCDPCGLRTTPVWFEDEEAYGEFLAAVHGAT